MKETSGRHWSLVELALLSLALVSGCSTFEHDWRDARRRDFPDSADGLRGAWEGHWRSDVNGHHGALRCILEPTGDGDIYLARFHATWGGIFTYQYSVPLELNARRAARDLSGHADLGRLAGGLYTYRGEVVDDLLVAVYNSSGDHGVFRLQRAVRSE